MLAAKALVLLHLDARVVSDARVRTTRVPIGAFLVRVRVRIKPQP